jgi:hypothetical protein
MATFERSAALKPPPRRAKNAPVFCVGWRVFVHWPGASGTAPTRLPLTDSAGNPLDNDLADGQQVEILSWKPRARDGVIYQIRRLADGSEWWIGAHLLRRQAKPEPVVEPSSGPAER